ncbi:MAG: hypothetical protein SNJ84_07455 [Verrucomicrobiia bacterium]
MRLARLLLVTALLGLSAHAQTDTGIGVIDKPLQIFLQPISLDGVTATLDPNPDTSAFLLEVIRATYQADLARLLTQHIAPTRLVDRKTRPSAPGWEITARLTHIQPPSANGQLALATTIEVVDLRLNRTLLTLNIRSGFANEPNPPAVDDDGTVTPWNPPPPRLRRPGVAQERIDSLQTEITLAARRAVHRLGANIRQGR